MGARGVHRQAAGLQVRRQRRPVPVLAEVLARHEELQGAMQKLTPDQREVLVLRFGMGMSHREIAEQTGRNEEAIRALQFRAIRSLRAIMGEDTD